MDTNTATETPEPTTEVLPPPMINPNANEAGDVVILLGALYNMTDVVTEKTLTTKGGAKLHKGGKVRPIYVFPAGGQPDADKVEEFYGFKPGTPAYKGANVPYKEARIVLERVEPTGKFTILAAKHTAFMTLDGAPPKGAEAVTVSKKKAAAMPRKETERPRESLSSPYTTKEAVMADLDVGQVWVADVAQEKDARIRIANIGRDDAGERKTVLLEYAVKVADGSQWATSGTPMPISDFVASMVAKGARTATLNK